MFARNLLRSPAIRPQQTSSHTSSTATSGRAYLRAVHIQKRLLDQPCEQKTPSLIPNNQALAQRTLTGTQLNLPQLASSPGNIQALPFTLEELELQIKTRMAELHETQHQLQQRALTLQQDVNQQLGTLQTNNFERLETNITTFNALQHTPMICAPLARPAITATGEAETSSSLHTWLPYRGNQQLRDLPELPSEMTEQLDREFPMPAHHADSKALTTWTFNDHFDPSLQCAQSAYTASVDALLDMAELQGDLTYNYLQGMRAIDQHSKNLMVQGNQIQTWQNQLPSQTNTPAELQQERRELLQSLRQATEDICNVEWFDNIPKMRKSLREVFEQASKKINEEMGQFVAQHSKAGLTMFAEVADSIFNNNTIASDMRSPTPLEVQQAYETLGLPNTATRAEVKKKFHELSRQLHPDKLTEEETARPDVQARFRMVMTAYQQLMRIFTD